MTEEQIKEHLSRDFLRLIAHRAGYSVDVPESDYGCDATLERFEQIENSAGEFSWSPSGQCMQVQLKCTTEASIQRSPDLIKYALRVKNYNDLVRRQQRAGGVVPLCLVLFVLPHVTAQWLQANPADLLLRGQGFWFFPPDGAQVSTAKKNSKKKIEIPTANLIGLSSVHELFEDFYS